MTIQQSIKSQDTMLNMCYYLVLKIKLWNEYYYGFYVVDE